jgi:nickel/cobalt exporter
MDADGDGQISSTEEQRYARRVLRDLALEVDGRPAPLTLTDVQFPPRRELNEGLGVIRLNLAAKAAFGGAGEHQLSFRNDHLPELGVYLANVLAPTTDAIAVTRQQRDPLQHGLRVDRSVRSAGARAWPRRTGGLLLGLCLGLLLARSQWKRRRQSGSEF